MSADGRITLRSYRLAFELERRIHRIDRFRIPLPYGLPLASLGWGVAVMIGVLVARGAPGLGGLVQWLPLPVQLVFLPGLGAHFLCRATQDGRPAHEVLAARLARRVKARRLVALRPAPRDTGHELLGAAAVVGDERDPELRRGTVRGPADVGLRHAVTIELRPGRAVVDRTYDRPLLAMPRLVLRDGERMEIR